MGAALDGVDGAGNLVGTVVPEPAGVAETHGHVAGLGRGETDLVVGSGVPELPQFTARVSFPTKESPHRLVSHNKTHTSTPPSLRHHTTTSCYRPPMCRR